jgi:hypothetical protein
MKSKEVPPHAYPPKVLKGIKEFQNKKLLVSKQTSNNTLYDFSKHIKMPLVKKMNLIFEKDQESFNLIAMSCQTSKRSDDLRKKEFISFKS